MQGNLLSYFIRNTVLLRGQNKTAEIDEAAFVKIKHNKVQNLDLHWFLGLNRQYKPGFLAV